MHWAAAFFAGDSHPDHHKPLDGLRGLAVLMVVFGHGANQDLGPFGPDSMMIRGKLGVYLFFVLSAYLLDRQIIKMFQQGRAQWDYWLYYISRRVLRITASLCCTWQMQPHASGAPTQSPEPDPPRCQDVGNHTLKGYNAAHDALWDVLTISSRRRPLLHSAATRCPAQRARRRP